MSDQESQNLNKVTFEEGKKIINLSKAQLKALGLQYKPPQTEAQQLRNQKLSEMAKARHEQHRKDKDEYEKAQLKTLSEKIVVDKKSKQKYIKQMVEVPLAESSDDETSKEFQDFLKFKKAQSKVKKVKPPPKDESSSDDEMIQKKIKKSTKILETVNKLDTAINKLSIGNPYLDLFNKPRK